MEYTHVMNTFEPVYDQYSEVLVLGSIPSVKSREQKFYYGHPQNRFWKVIAAICHETVPVTIDEKKNLLLRNHIAVWDVIAECDIIGASDSSIKNVAANDINRILSCTQIKRIYANGEKAYKLFIKYCRKEGQPDIIRLPSTSPANAAFNLEKLCDSWGEIVKYDDIDGAV
ncbi:MAG: DNA-deoxyinosine glycosylase [Eubacteriales bacterium]|nr:DNA-deoxyinosine glycosylase [Eubacteriales bacterium]